MKNFFVFKDFMLEDKLHLAPWQPDDFSVYILFWLSCFLFCAKFKLALLRNSIWFTEVDIQDLHKKLLKVNFDSLLKFLGRIRFHHINVDKINFIG